MVATAMGIETEHIDVAVEGDLDLRGTLGISKDVPVGFESIHLISTSPPPTRLQTSSAPYKKKPNNSA